MAYKITLAIFSAALLAGCVPSQEDADNFSKDANAQAKAVAANVKENLSEAGDHASYFGSAAKEGFYSVTDHVADWMRPTPKPKPQAIATSYCYHVLQDILCYHQPMPGWEHRLVGYQPLTAPSPPPAVMQPMAVQASNSAAIPANRAASAKPVFTTLPESKDKDKDASKDSTPLVADPSHEQLPDPALAPQL